MYVLSHERYGKRRAKHPACQPFGGHDGCVLPHHLLGHACHLHELQHGRLQHVVAGVSHHPRHRGKD